MLKHDYKLNKINMSIYRIQCISNIAVINEVTIQILSSHHSNIASNDILKDINNNGGILDMHDRITFQSYEHAISYIKLLNTYDILDKFLEN